MQAYEQFERDFGEYMGYKPEHIVACNSGTAALHLALEAFRSHYYKVAVPDFAFISCARAVSMAGGYHQFVDCDERLQMRLVDVDPDVNVIMVVHTYGRLAPRPRMTLLHTRVIEDMAELHGVKPSPSSDAACWSFHRNKIIAAEEGGMVAFQTIDRADAARKMRNLGLSDNFDFVHTPRGMNYRLTNAQAEILLRELNYVNENIEDRNKIIDCYNEVVPKKYHMPPRQAPWVYDLRVPGMTHEGQREIVKKLNAKGIAARCGFYPLSKQLEFEHLGFRCINALRLSAETMYLPVSPLMTPDDVFRNVTELLSILA